MSVQPQYKDYRKLIHQVAWSYHRNNPSLELEELVAQGNLAFVLATRSWRPDKGAFSTYLFYKLRGALGKVMRLSSHVEVDSGMADRRSAQPDCTAIFAQVLESLSHEAQSVVHLVLEVPLEVVDLTKGTIAPTMAGIRKYLCAVGWSRHKVRRVFREIRSALGC